MARGDVVDGVGHGVEVAHEGGDEAAHGEIGAELGVDLRGEVGEFGVEAGAHAEHGAELTCGEGGADAVAGGVAECEEEGRFGFGVGAWDGDAGLEEVVGVAAGFFGGLGVCGEGVAGELGEAFGEAGLLDFACDGEVVFDFVFAGLGVEELCTAEGDGGLDGEDSGDGFVGGVEGGGGVFVEDLGDAFEGAAGGEEGDGEDVAGAVAGAFVELWVEARVGVGVGDVEDLACAGGLAGDAFGDGEADLGSGCGG